MKTGFICLSAKIATFSNYDHIGIVVEESNGELSLLEANISGVTKRPLKERLLRSSSHSFAIRHLIGPKTDEFKAKLLEIANQLVGKKYNSSFTDMTYGLLTGYLDHGALKGVFFFL